MGMLHCSCGAVKFGYTLKSALCIKNGKERRQGEREGKEDTSSDGDSAVVYGGSGGTGDEEVTPGKRT